MQPGFHEGPDPSRAMQIHFLPQAIITVPL
jgi:hypothetical protein